MKACVRTLALIASMVLSVETNGMFSLKMLIEAPIDRVLTNLESRYAANTNDLATIYHLARVHSMAYATNLQMVPVEGARRNGTNDVKEPIVPEFGYPEETKIPRKVLLRS